MENLESCVHKALFHRQIKLLHFGIIQRDVCDIELIGLVSAIHDRLALYKLIRMSRILLFDILNYSVGLIDVS